MFKSCEIAAHQFTYNTQLHTRNMLHMTLLYSKFFIVEDILSSKLCCFENQHFLMSQNVIGLKKCPQKKIVHFSTPCGCWTYFIKYRFTLAADTHIYTTTLKKKSDAKTRQDRERFIFNLIFQHLFRKWQCSVLINLPEVRWRIPHCQ